MALDVELYRRTICAPGGPHSDMCRLSVIDIEPDGAARTLVFVHGFGGRALQWIHQLRALGQSMRVVAPDLRGHGASDDPDDVPLDMERLVADLELTLAEIEVRKPFVLVAHSFGGAITTEYALRHPSDVSGMVLIGVPTRFVLRPGTRQLMSIPTGLFETLAHRLNVALYAGPRTMRRMHDSAMAPWRGAERMEQLRVPTLVALGHRDTVFAQSYYADVPRCIPGAKQVVIPVSAHLVQLERPEAVNRAIRRFIEPKPSDPVAQAEQATRATWAARRAEMPWLQYYDGEVPEQLPRPKPLLHDLLGNAAREFPERPAIIFFGQRIGYRELDLQTNRFARALRAMGVSAGDRVAIILPNLPQCVIAFYGTLKAGAVAVLGTALSTEAEVATQIRDAEPRVLVTLGSYREMAQRVCAGTSVKQIIYTSVREYLPLPRRVVLASLIEGDIAPRPRPSPRGGETAPPGGLPTPLPGSQPASFQQYGFQDLLRSQTAAPLTSGSMSDDLALIQYTSGTTEEPRGVMLTHANLVVNAAQNRHWMSEARRGREVLLCALPLSHSYGLTSGLDLSVALAATLVLLPTMRTRPILQAIRRYHPGLFPGVPALYLAIANYPRVRSYGVASIRICVSGSAPLAVEVQEAFEKLTRGRLVEGYGLTEAAPVTHANPLQGERRIGSIGLPYPGTDARIIDPDTGERLPPGQVGELAIRGPQVMRGYWKLPTETAQVLTEGWLRTGDLARMDEDGFFTIVDREKDVILTGRYNVYPRDVEEVLYEHPKVLEAAVVGERAPAGADASGGGAQTPLIKAVVVLRRGEKATAEELLALCRERLDAYKVPAVIEFRSELPKNFVGKVLRRLLIES